MTVYDGFSGEYIWLPNEPRPLPKKPVGDTYLRLLKMLSNGTIELISTHIQKDSGAWLHRHMPKPAKCKKLLMILQLCRKIKDLRIVRHWTSIAHHFRNPT